MKLRRWTCPNCQTKNTSDLEELRKQSGVVYRGPQPASKPGEFLVKCKSCYRQQVIVVNENE
jgi:hypothetical protein